MLGQLLDGVELAQTLDAQTLFQRFPIAVAVLFGEVSLQRFRSHASKIAFATTQSRSGRCGSRISHQTSLVAQRTTARLVPKRRDFGGEVMTTLVALESPNLLMNCEFVHFQVFLQMETAIALVADVLFLAMPLHVVVQLGLAGEHLGAFGTGHRRGRTVDGSLVAQQKTSVGEFSTATLKCLERMDFGVAN